VSTIYTPDQMEAFAQQMEDMRPPTPGRDSHNTAPRAIKFASFGNGMGMVFRFKLENQTVRNFAFHPLVAAYLAAAISDVAEKLAWGINGETFHPDAVPRRFENPDPEAEERWQREWSKTKVVAPDVSTYDQAANVIAVNGDGALDGFAMAMVLDTGETTHLRMSPLVAWELSGAVYGVGEREGWWGDLDNVLPGKVLH